MKQTSYWSKIVDAYCEISAAGPLNSCALRLSIVSAQNALHTWQTRNQAVGTEGVHIRRGPGIEAGSRPAKGYHWR